MRGAIHEAEPCMGKGRGQGIGLGAWQIWQRRRSILTRRGIYLGGRSTTIIRHENEEATGIKDNGYSKKHYLSKEKKERNKRKTEKKREEDVGARLPRSTSPASAATVAHLQDRELYQRLGRSVEAGGLRT